MKISIAIILLGFKKKRHIFIHNSISLTKNVVCNCNFVICTHTCALGTGFKLVYSKGCRDEMKLPVNPSIIHPVIRPVHSSRHGLFTSTGQRKQWSTNSADVQIRFRQ
jgi:hypothetical protein